jgi:hypothetical protein
MLRLYLYARVRLYHHLLHTGPRVQQAPGIPCALFLWANELQSPGETRRGNAEVRSLPVIACNKREAFAQGSEAIHTFLAARWIASLRSQ